jgi:hypothetical protein
MLPHVRLCIRELAYFDLDIDRVIAHKVIESSEDFDLLQFSESQSIAVEMNRLFEVGGF